MPAAGTSTKSDERRRAIMAAAIDCFAQKGFYGTTTHEIAEWVGISQPYLYRLYPNKQALFAAAVDHVSVVMTETLVAHSLASGGAEPTSEAALDAARGAYAALVADRNILRFLMHANCAACRAARSSGRAPVLRQASGHRSAAAGRRRRRAAMVRRRNARQRGRRTGAGRHRRAVGARSHRWMTRHRGIRPRPSARRSRRTHRRGPDDSRGSCAPPVGTLTALPGAAYDGVASRWSSPINRRSMSSTAYM